MPTETESAGSVNEETVNDGAENEEPVPADASPDTTQPGGDSLQPGRDSLQPGRDSEQPDESLGTRSELEVVSACKRRIKATVPAEKVREELDKNYKELASSVQIPGFRRGRVPRKLLEARFGEEIESDVKEALLSMSLSEVIEANELDVVGSPSIQEVKFEKGADLGYVVDVEVRPQFELGSYSGIEVTREQADVRDEDVEERLKALQRRSSRPVPLAEISQAGPDDLYIGKYSLYRDGEKVKAGVEGAFTPASKVLHSFLVDDLPEKVKAWDSASPLRLKVRAGADYPDEVLRNTDLELEFQLEEARRPELPDIDDEFAKAQGRKDLADLRADVRKGLEDWNRRESDRKLEGKILEKILDATAMDLPESLVASILSRKRLEREYELLQKGLGPEEVNETLVREFGASQKEGESAAAAVIGAVSDEVRREIKEFFVLEKIADKEKIFVTEEEVDKRVHLMATLYGIPSGRIREELRSSGRLEELRLSLRNEKVRAFLRQKARTLGPDGQPEAAPASESAADTTERTHSTGEPEASSPVS